MQRADRETSPTHTSGEEGKVPKRYPTRTYQQGPFAQQPPLLAAAPQLAAPQHLPSRPASGPSDMHTALLALARLAESDADAGGGTVDDPSKQPAVYDPLSSTSAHPPSAPSSAIPAAYRPPLPIAPALLSPQYHQHNQLLQQLSLPPGGGAEASAETVLNSVNPQQLVHVLQLIISLQQLGCSLDQLEHPEVLPLMLSLLQTA